MKSELRSNLVHLLSVRYPTIESATAVLRAAGLGAGMDPQLFIRIAGTSIELWVSALRALEQQGVLLRFLEEVRRQGLSERVLSDAITETLASAPPVRGGNNEPVSSARVRLFISYDSADRRSLEHLEKHMAPLVRSAAVELWHEGRLAPGENWSEEINRRLHEADVIVALLSSDYLASDHCMAHVKFAMAQNEAGAARFVPVLVRSVSLPLTMVGKLQTFPRDGRPVEKYSSRDDAWHSVATELRRIVEYAGGRSLRGPLAAKTTESVGSSASIIGSSEEHEARPILSIGDIFRRGSQPDVTYVEPKQLFKLKVCLRTMGRGLVVDGPSGIGKTTAVVRALDEIAGRGNYEVLRALTPADCVRLDSRLTNGFKGHLVIDDFHHLDEPRQRAVASAIKTIADASRTDVKLTVIGINPVGVSLVHGFPDLVGRFDPILMAKQPDERIAELIRKGEAAANVVFRLRDELIGDAAGSFSTAQELCFHACVLAEVAETQVMTRSIVAGVREVREAVMDALDDKYRQRLRDFAAWDNKQQRPGACLALLWLLARDRESFVNLAEAKLQYPVLATTFDWLAESALAGAFVKVKNLSKLFFYNQLAGVLSGDDPQLQFYLQNLDWPDFAKKTGHLEARFVADGALHFVFDLSNLAPPIASVTAGRIVPAQASALPPSTLLHLSDLHFGTKEQARNWQSQLAEDLAELKARPDVIILSGDIANVCKIEEYEAAEEFLRAVMKEHAISPQRVVIVPGNHDLSWSISKKAYRVHRREDYDHPLNEGLFIDKGEYVETRNEEDYRKRFEPFAAFYQKIRNVPYPLEYASQATIDVFPDQRLFVLGLNSAWQLDHHYTRRANIHAGALSDALGRLRTAPEYANWLKLAVWHHPIHSDADDRIHDASFLERLAQAGFRLGLNGHVHKAKNDLFRYDMAGEGRRLDLVCAGTFGAPVREWVPGYPLGYNLIRIGGGTVTVETRRREELNGAWKPDARWTQGSEKDPLPRYQIAL